VPGLTFQRTRHVRSACRSSTDSTFTRDTAYRYYYLYGVDPTTWMQIAVDLDYARLKKRGEDVAEQETWEIPEDF
jgi:plasmid maintenance system antidote protein VapI